MAANKFATMLHRNTNKITLILVYALLEWILIFFLLLNSLFSYVIIRYAEYFGLQKPCVLCSRLDHLIDSKKTKNSYRYLVCDAHDNEISRLGFCSRHRKLSESKSMCEDSSSSSKQQKQLECPEMSRDYTFFSWMKKTGLIQGLGEAGVENGELNYECSCCGVSSKGKFYSPCILLKPSWDVLDYTQKENLIRESGQDDTIDDGDHFDFDFDKCRSGFLPNQLEEDEHKSQESGGASIEGTWLEAQHKSAIDVFVEKDQESNNEEEEEEEEEEELKVLKNDISYYQREIEERCVQEATSADIGTKHLEFYVGGDDCHSIPVKMMDSPTPEQRNGYKFKEEDQGDSGNEFVILDFTMHDVATQVDQSVVQGQPSSPSAATSVSELSNLKVRIAELEDELLS